MTQLPDHNDSWPVRRMMIQDLKQSGAIRRTSHGPWFTRDHKIATWWQTENAGVILQAEGGYEICCGGCKLDGPCQCRDPDHIKALAPSWDESHPDNAYLAHQPVQDELF